MVKTPGELKTPTNSAKLPLTLLKEGSLHKNELLLAPRTFSKARTLKI